jgi:hypothetical protein
MSIKHLLMITLLVVTAGCGDDGTESESTLDAAIADPGDGDGDADGGTDASAEDPIEIEGTWYNVTLDLVETFSSTAITGDFVPVDIVEYDNDLDILIARFEGDEGEPEHIYTKIVWLEPDASGFYYCPVAFEQASVEEARAAEDTSDSSDPDNGGCDGLPWMRNVPLDEMPDD